MRIGIDIGSTTIKCVVLDDSGNLIHKSYERHFAMNKEKTREVIKGLIDQFNISEPVVCAVSGSAGMGLAERDDAQCAATIGLTLYDGFLRLYPDMDGHAAELCVAKYREIYFEDVASAIPQLFDGVAETLHALRGEGILLAVASSRSSPSLLLFMRERAIDHLFSYILGSDSVSRHKPEPEAVEVILQRGGFNPSEAIVVGDMPVDILMARSASVRAVGVSWGNATREELTAAGADAVIDDIRELLPIVEQM